MSSSEGFHVDGLSAAWDGVPVVRQISLDVAVGELVVLMGPNGSGKSTLLRCIAGLEAPTEGSIRLNGRSLAGVPAHRRGIGLLFQEPALFPHRSVWQNIAYGPALQRLADEEVGRRVAEVAELLHLHPLLERRPGALSGGERQRVALARTLAARPSAVLLDEPFAAVDPELRGELRGDFRQALAKSNVGGLHVTHDREEGLFLGDRVAVLIRGRLRQVGTPRQVYERPNGVSVARFLGYNILDGADGRVAVAPRDLGLVDARATGAAAKVLASGLVGEERVTLLRSDRGDRWEARSPLEHKSWPAGARVGVNWSRSIPLSRSEDDGITG